MEEYTVFIDESFDQFMNLRSLDGWFCYGALMVPTKRLGFLNEFYDRLEARLIHEFEKETAATFEGEFKSSHYGKIPTATRRQLGFQMSEFLFRNQCYIGGFYTTTRSFLLYHLRSEIGGKDQIKLPTNPLENIERIKEEFLREKRKTPGESALLEGLFTVTTNIPLNLLGAQGKSFKVQYDPRNKKEDRYLFANIDELFPKLSRVSERYKDRYLGSDNSKSSDESSGLRFVDLLLREIRGFFQDIPELLSEGSEYRMITPRSQEGDSSIIVEQAGHNLKWGAYKNMSKATRSRVIGRTKNSMLPLLTRNLADQKLSCYAEYGEARIVDLREKAFHDMVD